MFVLQYFKLSSAATCFADPRGVAYFVVKPGEACPLPPYPVPYPHTPTPSLIKREGGKQGGQGVWVGDGRGPRELKLLITYWVNFKNYLDK